MKRFFAGWLSVLSFLLLASCGSDGDKPPSPEVPTVSARPSGSGHGGDGSNAPGASPSPASAPSPQICTLEYVYGLVVTVSGSGGEAISNAQVLLVDGDYREFAASGGPVVNQYFAAGERAGGYQVTVSAPGYAEKRFTATVEDGVCHVKRIDVNIKLERI